MKLLKKLCMIDSTATNLKIGIFRNGITLLEIWGNLFWIMHIDWNY